MGSSRSSYISRPIDFNARKAWLVFSNYIKFDVPRLLDHLKVWKVWSGILQHSISRLGDEEEIEKKGRKRRKGGKESKKDRKKEVLHWKPFWISRRKMYLVLLCFPFFFLFSPECSVLCVLCIVFHVESGGIGSQYCSGFNSIGKSNNVID